MLVRHHEGSDKKKLSDSHWDSLQKHCHEYVKHSGGMSEKGVENSRAKEDGDAKMEINLKSVSIVNVFCLNNCIPPNSCDSQEN